MSRQMLCVAVLLCCLLAGALLVGCSDNEGGDIGALISAIVFMRGDAAGEESGDVWLMRQDGSDKVLIDDPTYWILQGVLSPDGTKLVATADWEALRVLDLRTGNWSTPYNSGSGNVAHPAFSPDGQTIIFRDSDDGQDTIDIFTVPVGGGAATKLRNSTTSGEYYLLPSYNRVGTQIVFQLNDDGWNGQNVAVMDPDGSDLDVLQEDAMHPSFLPDGRILFINLDSNNEIWVMDPDGGNQVALGNTPQNASFPTCSPDGAFIAWAQGPRSSRDIYVASFDGTNLGAPVNITTDTDDACWRPMFGLIASNLYPN